MRFLFVASGKSTPSTRFRILQYLPLLEAAGHRCDLAYSFPEKYDYFAWMGWRLSQRLKRTVRHWHAFLAARRRYDAIFVEREVFDDETSDLEQKFRRATSRLILDVDDGVFLRHPEKFDRIAGICDVAIAGNHELENYLIPRCRHVEIIPTCIRMAEYPPRPFSAATGRPPVIGWMGTSHNVPFLSVAAGGLSAVASRHSFRLLVVTNSAERLSEVDLPGVDVEIRSWDPQREVADLHDMDIGLMPLPADQPWMKYKCAAKLLQYLAVSIPAIASPIGVNREILKDASVGLSAESDAQWQAAIEQLLTDEQRRKQLGAAGRQLVQQRYSIEANWKHLEEILTGQRGRGSTG